MVAACGWASASVGSTARGGGRCRAIDVWRQRIEEQIEAMRLLWTQPLVTYHGKHVVLDEVALHPRPDRSIPIWMVFANFDSGGMPRQVTIKRPARISPTVSR